MNFNSNFFKNDLQTDKLTNKLTDKLINNLKWVNVFIILILFITFVNNSYSYTPLSNKEIKELIPSDTRIILNLFGSWKKTNDDGITTVKLPKSELEQSQITYEKTVRIDKKLIDNYAFQFYILGFDDQAEIYINGQFLGRYFGGMTTFSVQIPSKVIFNETNNIKIIVTPAETLVKKIKENTIYSKKIFTGIIREIFLVATPKIWISELKYNQTFENDNYSRVNINTNFKVSTSEITKLLSSLYRDTLVANTIMKAEVTAKTYIYDNNNNLVAESNLQNFEVQRQRTYTLNSNMTVLNPNLWSPSEPYLYNLRVKITKNNVLIDEYSSPLGIREIKPIKANNKNIFALNGKDFYFKALTYVEDYGKSYQTLTSKRMEEDIAMIKSLGVNIIRFKFNSPHPYLINLCNKYGIMALVELPIYDVPSSIINSDEVKVRMKNIMERNLMNFESNPSVIAYGLYAGAEENNQEVMNYEKSLISLIKKNSKKMIYKIININSTSTNTNGYDFIGIKDNVIKNNIMDVKKDLINIQNLIKDKPIFVNYGVTNQPNNKNGYSDPLSPEFQAYYLRNIFHLIKERELVGGCFNTFNDYRIENPLLISNNENQFIAYMGLVDINRNTRLSFKTLQTLYNEEKEPLLNVGSYSEKAPVTYIIIGFIAIIILLLLFNKYKRFNEYIKRAIFRPYNFYADIRDQRIMSLPQTIILGIVLSLSVGTFLSSLLYFYKNSEIAQYILMILIPVKSIQSILFNVIWMPELLMFIFTVLFFLLMLITSSIMRFISIFIKKRVFFIDTITMSIWSGLPFLVILPFSIVLVKILVNYPNSIWLFSLLLVFLSVWVFMRILKSVSVVFDKNSTIVNIIGLTTVIFFLGIPIFIYQNKYQFIDYINYLFTVIIGI